MKRCLKCNAQVADGYRICPNCGSKDFVAASGPVYGGQVGQGGVPPTQGISRAKQALVKPFKQATLLPTWLIVTIIASVAAFFGLMYASTGWVSDAVAKSAPIEVETAMLEGLLQDEEGRQLINAALPDEHPFAKMTRRIGSDLLAARTAPGAYQYQFLVVPKDEINAFAVPGGLIVIYTGLINVLDTPEQLGAVIAHEIAHVELRHTLRQQYRSIGTLALMGILFGVAQDTGTLMSVNLLSLKYSRDHETEADLEGARLLARAGVSPKAAVSMLEKLEEIESGWIPTMLSEHPKTGIRAKRLAQLPEIQLDLPESNAEWRGFIN